MNFDANKLRAGTPAISTISGSVLFNQREDKMGPSGAYPSIDANKFRGNATDTAKISGFTNLPTKGENLGAQNIPQADEALDANKLRTTNKQVTLIGGSIASLKG